MQDKRKKNLKKQQVKSMIFLIVFWSLTALYMAGLCRLLQVVDLTAAMMRLLGA